MAKIIMATCLLVLVSFACRDRSGQSEANDRANEKIIATYKLKFKHSDSLPHQEILLELILENRNDFGVMIKAPFIKATDIETGNDYNMANLYDGSDHHKIPTYLAYEDSLRNPIKNPMEFKLKEYVLDSLSKSGEKFDNLNSDLYGFVFVKPLSKSVFLMDLTLLLHKLNGNFKIYAYHKSDFYNYGMDHVPAVFQGYRKIRDDIHFDTFYVSSNKKFD